MPDFIVGLGADYKPTKEAGIESLTALFIHSAIRGYRQTESRVFRRANDLGSLHEPTHPRPLPRGE